MGWLGSLLGARKVDGWELFKQAAQAETERLRDEMERRPRLGAEKIASCAEYFETFEGISAIYPQMRRDDFCEAALLALKSGTLEESQFNLVMYTREWVVSGADKRIDFPSWLQGEGRQRFTVHLNRQWLASGHRTMTFNDWYVQIKSDLR